MINDKTYQLLVAKMHEVAIVPPQELGPFTHLYRQSVSYFKSNLWKSVGGTSFIMAVILYLILGPALVKLASLLQFGF